MLTEIDFETADAGFPAADDLAVARALHPSSFARRVAQLRSAGLDRALAAGDDPTASALLAARAAALSAPDARKAIAEQLEGLVRTAQHPHGRWRVPPHRSAVGANATEIRALGERLRRDAPVGVRGVAMLKRLLRDGTGPVYVGDAERLARRLDDAATRLM